MSMERSERSEFIGAHVTPEIKRRLRDEADKSGTSMSLLIETAIREMLQRLKKAA